MEPSDPTLIFSKSRFRAELEPIIRKAVEDALVSLQTRVQAGEKAWLTNEECAEYLGLSRASLARYRAEGKLPYSKPFGQNVFYRLEDVKALLKASAV